MLAFTKRRHHKRGNRAAKMGNALNAKSLAAAAGVVAVIISLFGFLWSIKQDIVGLHRDIVGIHQDIVGIHRDIVGIHQDIAGIHQDIAGIHRDIGGLRERMARIEVIIEGFTGQAAPTAAGSSIAKNLSKADLRKVNLREAD